jgi:hypothetical protein
LLDLSNLNDSRIARILPINWLTWDYWLTMKRVAGSIKSAVSKKSAKIV